MANPSPDEGVRAASVSDLAAERNKREQPDPEHVLRDGFGRTMFRFLLEYTMDDGSEWCLEVWAANQGDAENRVAAIRQSAVLRGQIFEGGPA